MYTHICVCTLCCDASNVRQTFSAARRTVTRQFRVERHECVFGKKSVEGGEMWFRSVARSEEESCVRKLRRKSLRSERLLSAHESQCRRWYLSKHDGGNVCVTPRIRASSRAETASEFSQSPMSLEKENFRGNLIGIAKPQTRPTSTRR